MTTSQTLQINDGFNPIESVLLAAGVRAGLDLKPLMEACHTAKLPINLWNTNNDQFSIVVPFLSRNQGKLIQDEGLISSGLSLSVTTISVDNKPYPVCLVGQTVSPYQVYHSAFALSEHLDSDARLLSAAARVFEIEHKQELLMPPPPQVLLAGHDCIEKINGSTVTEQFEQSRAQLYQLNDQASLFIPFTEIPDSEVKFVLNECKAFLDQHQLKLFHIGRGDEQGVLLQIPITEYNDLREFAKKLNLTIVSE
jgi:hypothetical protein